MPEVLPRFHRFQERLEDERKIARAILEGDVADLPPWTPPQTSEPTRK